MLAAPPGTISPTPCRRSNPPGYYAWANQPFTEDRQREVLQTAVAASSDETGIGVRAAFSRDPKASGSVRLSASLDAPGIVFAHDFTRADAQYRGDLKIVVAAYNSQGNPVSARMESVDAKFTPQQHDEVMKNGVPFADNLPIPEGTQKLRFIVLDCISGAIGSVTIPLK